MSAGPTARQIIPAKFGQHAQLPTRMRLGLRVSLVPMIPALATLLVFQLMGEALVFALAAPMPGPVVGLALLLLVLVIRPTWISAIKPTAHTLLQHLSLLFVPAGVGVMLHLQRLGDEALAIGVALILSTLVGLGTAALTMAWLMKHVSRSGTPAGVEPP
jgi:holin-like protein